MCLRAYDVMKQQATSAQPSDNGVNVIIID